MMIHRSEITLDGWINTSYLRTDGKDEFRERKEYGNRHVVFTKGSEWGKVHHDEYNATDFPVGTVNHAAKYVEEKSGISQDLVALGITSVGLYAGYKLLKYLLKEDDD